MPTHRLVVFTEPTAGREDEYNQWYDEVHLKEVLATEGFVGAQRFALSDAQIGDVAGAAPSRYLAIYEIEADENPDFRATSFRYAFSSPITPSCSARPGSAPHRPRRATTPSCAG